MTDRSGEVPVAFASLPERAFPFDIHTFDSRCPHREVWTQRIGDPGSLVVPGSSVTNEGVEVIVRVEFNDGTVACAPESWHCPACEWRNE
jgi:hypothetical protein